MIEQFEGSQGQGALLNALRNQFLVDGNTELAKKMAAVVMVKQFSPGSELFSEGHRGGELFFIIAGEVSIQKRGREIAKCSIGTHVGEIGLLEPFKERSATVVAIDTVVVAQITQLKFNELAESYPTLWRHMALALAHRLVASQDAV